MTKIIADDFLLTNDYAAELYHEYAKELPIIDFHNHLSPIEIADNTPYETITDIWLGGDHYKWRLMRANGIHEYYVSGEASPWEKFEAWAETVPNTLGNPLFHWTQMELKRYFGIDEVLSNKNAKEIWDITNRELQKEHMHPRQLLVHDKVEFVGTTDDPTDPLDHHKRLLDEKLSVQVAPSFRPDKGLDIESSQFDRWLKKLERAAGKEVNGYLSFLQALSDRVDYFDQHGCRASDHGISEMYYEEASEKQVSDVFQKRLRGEGITKIEADQFRTYTLQFLAERYFEKDWAMQFHLGALRNNNTKMFQQIGRDSGYDSPGDSLLAKPLSRFLDSVNSTGKLPKTVLYCLN
ncbi:glucuronate isomerase, partial [Halobacillus rhizosphaerae]|uniref:glucuronate isomerase n=1 Tax=Halobacillus rhizosphaerae TaxID=3064889 RepID=UPI00398A9338